MLDLIAKIGAEIPQADMNNVNIAGTFRSIGIVLNQNNDNSIV